jgi:HAMP domain-containing protein
MVNWRENFHEDPDRAKRARGARKWLRRLGGGVKTWVLLAVLVIFVALAAVFLRANNLGMIERRSALETADKTGDITKVQTAAKNLQNYVARHMNTETGQIALQTLYDQAVQKTLDANRPQNVEMSDWQNVTNECRSALYTGGYQAQEDCIKQKIGDFAGADAAAPNPALYYVDYAPARWSLDAAGIFVLLSLLMLLVLLIRAVMTLIMKIVLRFKYKRA